jgi:hypothetical protein
MRLVEGDTMVVIRMGPGVVGRSVVTIDMLISPLAEGLVGLVEAGAARRSFTIIVLSAKKQHLSDCHPTVSRRSTVRQPGSRCHQVVTRYWSVLCMNLVTGKVNAGGDVESPVASHFHRGAHLESEMEA